MTLIEWLNHHAELCEADSCPEEAKRCREAATRIAELERENEILLNGKRDLESRHSALREAVGRGKGCCCHRCLPDIAAEVTAWRVNAERWRECERRAKPLGGSLWQASVYAPLGIPDTFAAAIDAAIAEEKTNG